MIAKQILIAWMLINAANMDVIDFACHLEILRVSRSSFGNHCKLKFI